MDNIVFSLGFPNIQSGYNKNNFTEPLYNMVSQEEKNLVKGIFKVDLKYTITIWQKNIDTKIPMGHSSAALYKDILQNIELKLAILPLEIKNNFWFKIIYNTSYLFYKSFIDEYKIDIDNIIHNSGLFVPNEFRNQGIAKKLIQKRMNYFNDKIMLCNTTNIYSSKVFNSCGWINIGYIAYNKIFNHFNIENNILNDDRFNLWIYFGEKIKDVPIFNLNQFPIDLTDNVILSNIN
jgi:predicted GNAT family acetyltransferase